MAAKKTKAAPAEVVTAYKGFDKDLSCRGYQYAIGESYSHQGEIAVCESGFHACENPLDVWRYYPINGSRFCLVVASKEVQRSGDDSKIASSQITVKVELSMREIICHAVKVISSLCIPAMEQAATTGNYSHAATTGDSAHAATTGYYAHAATTGDSAHAATTGRYAHAATTGDYAHAATTGYYAHAAATGYYAHAATTGNYSHAATTGNSAHAATTGGSAHAATTGRYAHAATTGNYSHAATTGRYAISAALGIGGVAKAGEDGCVIVRDDCKDRPRVVVGYVGEGGIKADTWYRAEGGKLVEVAR